MGPNPACIRRVEDTQREFFPGRNEEVPLRPGDGFTLVLDDHLFVLRLRDRTTPQFVSLMTQSSPNFDFDLEQESSSSATKRRSESDITATAPLPKRAKPYATTPPVSIHAADTLKEPEQVDSDSDLDAESQMAKDEAIARQLQEELNRQEMEEQRPAANTSRRIYGGPTQPQRASNVPTTSSKTSSSSLATTATKRPHNGSTSPELEKEAENLDEATQNDMFGTYSSSTLSATSKPSEPPPKWVYRELEKAKNQVVTSRPLSRPLQGHQTSSMIPSTLSSQSSTSRQTSTIQKSPGAILPVVKRKSEVETQKQGPKVAPTAAATIALSKTSSRGTSKTVIEMVNEVLDDDPLLNTSGPLDAGDDEEDETNILNQLDTSPNKKKSAQFHRKSKS
jgi:hypothetical protein